MAELGHAPMLQHPGMQEILIDGGQLVLENPIEMLNDLGV